MVSWWWLSLQKSSVLLPACAGDGHRWNKSQVTCSVATAACSLSPGTTLHKINWRTGSLFFFFNSKQSSLASLQSWLPLLCLCFTEQYSVVCDVLQATWMPQWLCLHDWVELKKRTARFLHCVHVWKGRKAAVSFPGLWLKRHGWIVRYAGTKKHPFSLAYKCSDG